ncbi:MAG TPA: alpha/beta fold hydrolase [Verrucomicrobiae bacterium]|jgi:alpha-beta hydrolase superfamily lysophospholipase
MRRLWQALNGLLIFVACVFSGCATYQPSAQVSPDFKPRDVVPALPEMANAHRQGAIEFLHARGARIPIRAFGTNGTLRPVIMTHGLESHSGWFVQSAAFMAGLGHPVYLVDRRGSGLSQERRGHNGNFHQWSRDLENVARWALNRHHTNQLHVIGHCFGAIPATVFTIEHSNLVASLILPTPGFATSTDLSVAQKLHVLGDHLGRKSNYLPVPLKTEQFTDSVEFQEFIRNDKLKLHEVTSAFYWNVNDARKFVRAHLEAVQCPVWMGLAGRDEIVEMDPTRALFRDFGVR